MSITVGLLACIVSFSPLLDWKRKEEEKTKKRGGEELEQRPQVSGNPGPVLHVLKDRLTAKQRTNENHTQDVKSRE